MHSLWSVFESAPVPRSDSYCVTVGNANRNCSFSVHGRSDDFAVFGEQHDVGGYPAAARPSVSERVRRRFSPQPMGFGRREEV
jgi:hypothetical protein